MQHTATYQFPLPECYERPSLAVVRETSQQMETALLSHTAVLNTLDRDKAEIVTGTYTGNGSANRKITLGFTPKAVLIESESGERLCGGYSYIYGGLTLQGYPLCRGSTSKGAEITEGGFLLYAGSSSMTNSTNMTFFYLAIK